MSYAQKLKLNCFILTAFKVSSNETISNPIEFSFSRRRSPVQLRQILRETTRNVWNHFNYSILHLYSLNTVANKLLLADDFVFCFRSQWVLWVVLTHRLGNYCSAFSRICYVNHLERKMIISKCGIHSNSPVIPINFLLLSSQKIQYTPIVVVATETKAFILVVTKSTQFNVIHCYAFFLFFSVCLCVRVRT